jgi:hypothetical protein
MPPGPAVTAIGWLMALWCVGFAVTNIVLESTDYLADGEYADYAAALTVALLSVAKRPRPMPPRLLGTLVWGSFATLAVYALGSVAQALGMVLGLMGSADQVDLAGVAYLAFFLTAAVGWSVLAVSYSKRHALGWTPAVIGVPAGPAVLGLVLVAMPALLTALGTMPT